MSPPAPLVQQGLPAACARRSFNRKNTGFTIAEVCVAVAVCSFFAAAAWSTNQRLLVALKWQKETTAATMVLQERMEVFRATPFSNIANNDYVRTRILRVRPGSEAPLGNLTETITIGVYPPDGSATTSMVWTAANPSGQFVTTNNSLGSATLLRVDVLETWTSANGRSRSRQLSSIFGLGNVAP